MARRFAGERLVARHATIRASSRDRGPARALRASTRWAPARSACPSPRRPAPPSRTNAALKARAAARGERAAGARRRFRAGRAGAGRRARHLFRALGRARRAISRWRWAGRARARRRRRPAAPISSPCWRSPGPTGMSRSFAARSHGSLVFPPRGTRGFGYDPIFVPDGRTQTFGEMDPAQEARHQPPRRGVPQASPPPVWARHDASSRSTSTGRSASRNAPIATSTAMCAPAIDEARWRAALLRRARPLRAR